MNREELERLISAELDGEISPEDEARLQQALAEDGEFRRLYGGSRRLGRAFAELRAERPGPPTGLEERVLEGVRRRSAEEGEPSRGRVLSLAGRFRPLAAAAAVVLLVAGSFLAGRQTTRADVSSEEAAILERFERSVVELGLPREEAESLLGRFEAEVARIETERRSGLRRAAEELEERLRVLEERVRQGR